MVLARTVVVVAVMAVVTVYFDRGGSSDTGRSGGSGRRGVVLVFHKLFYVNLILCRYTTKAPNIELLLVGA